jgi:hypothetical protein
MAARPLMTGIAVCVGIVVEINVSPIGGVVAV